MRALAAIGRSGAQLGGVVTMAEEFVERPEVLRHLAHPFIVRVHHDRIAGLLETRHGLDEHVTAKRLHEFSSNKPPKTPLPRRS